MFPTIRQCTQSVSTQIDPRQAGTLVAFGERQGITSIKGLQKGLPLWLSDPYIYTWITMTEIQDKKGCLRLPKTYTHPN